MPGVRLDLTWWPLPDDERIGRERALELVRAIRAVIGPMVDACEADLRSRIPYKIDVVQSGAPASYLADQYFGDWVNTICIGTVYQTNAPDPIQNAFGIDRDGTVSWRRCYTHAQRLREGVG